MTTPSYYLSGIKKARDGCGVEAMDVIDDLGLNFNLGCVIKYVWRAGKKSGNTEIEDLLKSRDCLTREINRIESLLARTRSFTSARGGRR